MLEKHHFELFSPNQYWKNIILNFPAICITAQISYLDRNQSKVNAKQPLWKFLWSFWSNSSDCMAKLGANMVKDAYEIDLYIT